MKKFIKPVTIAALLLSFLISFGYINNDSFAETSGKLEKNAYKAVLSFPIGEILHVGVNMPSEQGKNAAPDCGPQKFAIASNGDVYITDTAHNPSNIIRFSARGEYLETIPAKLFVDDEYGVSDIIIVGDELYACTLQKKIFSYNLKTRKIKSFEIPEEALDVSCRGLLYANNSIVLHSYDPNYPNWYLDLNDGVFKKGAFSDSRYNQETSTYSVRFNNTDYNIKIDKAATIIPLGQDKDNCLIAEYHQGMTVAYVKFSKTGKNIGTVYESYSDQELYMLDSVRVCNGELYRAHCTTEKFYLDRVVFDGVYGDPDALLHRFSTDISKTQTRALSSNLIEAEYTPSEVLQRASTMNNLEWEVKSSSNVTNTSEITVPSKYKQQQLRGVAVGTEITGIPYCWGGMNGADFGMYTTTLLYQNNSSQDRYEVFTDRINAGKRAGNTNDSQSFRTGSAGVDCSGFVGLCLGLREKHQAVDFVTCGHSVSFYSVVPGDILAKDGHVVLVSEGWNNSSVRIYESTRGTYATSPLVAINGVIHIYRGANYFTANGEADGPKEYVARRPYHNWVVSNNRVVCSSSTCTAVSGTVGDANGKDGINTADATFVLNYTAGRFILTKQEKKRADINGDGIVNTADATAILNLV